MNPILEAVMKARREAGLFMEFVVPGRSAEAGNFTCYAKDEAQKAAWLSKYEAKGWKLVS